MRELMANALVIGMAVAFLWHFSLIAILGTFTIQEPNPWILGLEIAMMVGCIVFAVLNIIKWLTSRRKQSLRR